MGKTVVETYELYGGEVKLDFLPNSHTYKVDGEKKIGVTTITGIINKPALMLWPRDEMLMELTRRLVKNPMSMGIKKVTFSVEQIEETLGKASNAYLYKQKRGTDAGTAGHDWLEHWLLAIQNGTEQPARLEPIDIKATFGAAPDEYDDEYIRATDHNNIVKAIENFIAWFENNDVEVVDVERIVYSRQYDFCGKFDALLRIDGNLILVDFKTSNPSMEFQEGIYPENFAQLGGYDVALTEEFPDMQIDGHAIFNLSKKNGQFTIKTLSGDIERQKNRDFFLATLLVKRGMQDRTRLLSSKYRENEKKAKAKSKSVAPAAVGNN